MPHKATPDLPITHRARPTRGLPSDPGIGDEECARDTPRLAPQGGPLDTPIIRSPVFGTKARLTGKTGPSRAAARPGPKTKNISCWTANGKMSKIAEQTETRRGIAPVKKKRGQYHDSWGDPRGRRSLTGRSRRHYPVGAHELHPGSSTDSGQSLAGKSRVQRTSVLVGVYNCASS